MKIQMPGPHILLPQYNGYRGVVVYGGGVDAVGVQAGPVQRAAQHVQHHVEGARQLRHHRRGVRDGRGRGVRYGDSPYCVGVVVHPV